MFEGLSATVFRAGVRIPQVRRSVLPRLSPDAAQIMAVGDAHHWPFRVLGRAPLVERPLFTGSWWLVPAQQETSPLPSWALQRVRTLNEVGVQARGYVVAHETPKVLQAGRADVDPTPWWRRQLMELASRPGRLLIAGLAIAILGPLLLELLSRVVLIAGAILALPLAVLGLGAVALADPILIAVTEDNVWIEIARW